MDNININHHIKNFLVHIRIEKNYSQKTRETYSIALSLFAEFLQEKQLMITEKDCIISFIRYLKNRGNNDTTIAHRLAILHSFFNYLVKKEIIKRKKLPPIEKYKTTKKIITIPTDDEVNLFIETIEQEYLEIKAKMDAGDKVNERVKAKYHSLFRDLTLFTLIIATGLRISEAIGIKIQDINWHDCSIEIFGKGNKERITFFGIDRIKNLFTELLNIREELSIESPYFFVSFQHKRVLTARYIQKTMKSFLYKTFSLNSHPSSPNYTPHTFRHYYATRSIEKGANIKAIAVLLGHADVSTTLRMYFHISTSYLKKVFETMNPFSNITLPVEEMIKKRYELVVNI